MFYLLEIFIVLVIFKVILKLTTGICKSNACLVGKTAIVTGGSAGIGYETALALASRGCRVIIASRTSDEKIKDEIIKRTNNPNIVAKSLDLSSFESVRKFAADINATEEKLDILVNNAGIGGGSKITADGLNVTMQINHFGPFLLTHLLTDLLKKSAPSRIVFVSSILAFTNKFEDIEVDLVKPSNELKNRAYSNSKLCNVITSQGFAEKLEKYGVTSNSLHPGAVATDIFRKSIKSQSIIKFIYALPGLFFKNPYEGAQTTVHLAVSNKVKDITGKYFLDCVQFPKPSKALDEELCKKIWELSERVVKLNKDLKL